MACGRRTCKTAYRTTLYKKIQKETHKTFVRKSGAEFVEATGKRLRAGLKGHRRGVLINRCGRADFDEWRGRDRFVQAQRLRQRDGLV